MVETDHTPLDTTKLPPEPAIPILASHLLELEEEQRKIFSSGARGDKIKTGCREIDDLLGGGLERGILAGISADGDTGRLISLHLLASVLVTQLSCDNPKNTKPKSKVSIIDSTGSFPLSLLARVLRSRILAAQETSIRTTNQTASHQLKGKGDKNEAYLDVDGGVQRCLEMVAISRVFDIEGLWEVLDEVGRDTNHDTEGKEAMPSEEPLEMSKGDHIGTQKLQEIADSQDDGIFEEDSLSATPEPTAVASEHHGTELIIVDNMTNIINELFSRKEKGDAHTLLNILSQTLHSLSQRHNILTILHNTAVPVRLDYSPTAAAAAAPPPHHPRTPAVLKKPAQPSNPTLSSIFPSNTTKPSLGQIFAQLPSLHLFLSSLPRTRADVDLYYGQHNTSIPPASPLNKVRFCTVLEVLKDETPILGDDRERGRRFGWREQKWTALDTSTDGTRLTGAFQTKGNMRGMGLERVEVTGGRTTDMGMG